MSFVEVNCNEITLDLDDESNRTYLGEKFMDDENTIFKLVQVLADNDR